MPTTPHSNIDHFELNGNPEVPINDALDDLDHRLNAWYVLPMADANQNLLTTLDAQGDPVALRNRAFEATGALTAGRDVTLPDEQGVYYFWNNTTGGFAITVKTVTDTVGVAVPAGDKVVLLVEATTFDVRSWTPSVNKALNDLTDVSTAGAALNQVLAKTGAGPDAFSFVTVDAGLPPGYVSGFKLTNNATDPNHDLDIGAGSARDVGDTVDAKLASTLVKQLDAAWAEGTNLGGLFSGTVAADTWYHVILIRQDSSGDVDAGFDTDIDGANKPTGWTVIRRLGSVRTDSSTNANIIGFQHLVDQGVFLWDDPVLDVDVADQGATAVNRTLTVPPGLNVKAVLNVFLSHATTQTRLYLRQPGVNDEAPSDSAGPLSTMRTGASGAFQADEKEVYTNASSQVSSRADQASTTLKIATLGWAEGLGHGSGGGGGDGGAQWVSVDRIGNDNSGAPGWDFAVDGATDIDSITFTGLGDYKDLMIVVENVTKSASANLLYAASVDNGASYFVTSGDYVVLNANGTTTNVAVWGGIGASASSAQSFTGFVPNAGVAGWPKTEVFNSGDASKPRQLRASTAAVNAIRMFTGTGPANLTGGKIWVLLLR